jgi:hypothetical protein
MTAPKHSLTRMLNDRYYVQIMVARFFLEHGYFNPGSDCGPKRNAFSVLPGLLETSRASFLEKFLDRNNR